jgi:hypothetical protein
MFAFKLVSQIVKMIIIRLHEPIFSYVVKTYNTQYGENHGHFKFQGTIISTAEGDDPNNPKE